MLAPFAPIFAPFVAYCRYCELFAFKTIRVAVIEIFRYWRIHGVADRDVLLTAPG
jgi:hypothetical protein